MPRHRGAAGLLAPGGPDWAGGRQALWPGECGPSGAPPGWMLSHLFVGGSHFGALTGVEIAGRDGGALGSYSELSRSDRKELPRRSPRESVRYPALGPRASLPLPLLCCCQGRPLARDHSGGYLQPCLSREGGEAGVELRVTAWSL